MTETAEADTGQMIAVESECDPELQRIRYRLGVLVAFWIVIPLAVAFITLALTAE